VAPACVARAGLVAPVVRKVAVRRVIVVPMGRRVARKRVVVPRGIAPHEMSNVRVVTKIVAHAGLRPKMMTASRLCRFPG